MSTLLYQHALNGKGVGAGLPLRRASKLYHVEPNIVYPTAFSTGLDSDLHAYSKGIFLRVPHLPVTRLVEPYINNHKAGGSNFTRRQFFVVKRGQPLMASSKRESQIGLFAADGSVEERTYIEPEKMAGRGTFEGYSADGGTTLIDQATYDSLEEGKKYLADGTEDATNGTYDSVDFYEVYSGLEDTNDKIPTGGVDQRADIEEALFGSTSLAVYVELDADGFYFGQAKRTDGFIAPSTGGFDRTIFYNEVDQEAGVTLPTDGSGAAPRIVTPVGNTTDVRIDNVAGFQSSATILTARPTTGFAHTDLEQATSHRWHMFQTGMDVHSPMRKGQHVIPFIDVVKLKAIIAEKAPSIAFDFSDLSNNKSGLKVGVSVDAGASSAKKLSVQNKYSLFTAADAGYANLYYNFGAPFLTLTGAPRLHQTIVPDLYGNFTALGAGYFADGAVVADTEAEFGTSDDFDGAGAGESYALSAAELAANVDGAQEINAAHKCGKIINVFDMPAQSMIKYVVNNQHQLRQTNDFVSDMYSRVRSADTAGLEPILADIILMVLGGSSYEWASNYIPQWDNRRQNIAKIMEDLVIAHAVGMVEIASNVITD